MTNKSKQDDNMVANTPAMPTMNDGRRRFVTRAVPAGVLAALTGWVPAFRVDAASASARASAATCAIPPNFPAGISLFQQAFRNWSGELRMDEAWTCSPRSDEEVVAVVNWAWRNGYKARARGQQHGWSPLIFQSGQTCADRILLIDTGSYLTDVRIDQSAVPARVSAQTGVLMEDLMAQLEEAGLGFLAAPAPGDITLGGVLAIDGHGTAVPALGEQRLPGQTYGSVSNNILALTAVVWDSAAGAYVLKTFDRSDQESAAFLVHLGRAFVTRATLQVGKNADLRCQSRLDIAATELFAAPGSSGRTFSSFLDSSGRVETILFPFTANPWLKVWTVAPTQPLFTRKVTHPYNYSFSDSIPLEVSDLISRINLGDAALTPTLGTIQAGAVAGGLVLTGTSDLWGPSKNSLLYIKPTTLRVTANGYAVITSRANVQQVLYDFYSQYQSLLGAERKAGRYPVNGPLEIRVTGLDHPAEVAVDGAVSPSLSALRPDPAHPERDVAVWLDILNIPGTKDAAPFYRQIEQWLLSRFNGGDAMVRVEWSKGWAYSELGAWDDATVLGRTIPASLGAGRSDGGWDSAVGILDKYDPARVFSSPLLELLMPPA